VETDGTNRAATKLGKEIPVVRSGKCFRIALVTLLSALGCLAQVASAAMMEVPQRQRVRNSMAVLPTLYLAKLECMSQLQAVRLNQDVLRKPFDADREVLLEEARKPQPSVRKLLSVADIEIGRLDQLSRSAPGIYVNCGKQLDATLDDVRKELNAKAAASPSAKEVTPASGSGQPSGPARPGTPATSAIRDPSPLTPTARTTDSSGTPAEKLGGVAAPTEIADHDYRSALVEIQRRIDQVQESLSKFPGVPANDPEVISARQLAEISRQVANYEGAADAKVQEFHALFGSDPPDITEYRKATETMRRLKEEPKPASAR
jgi:hypothetical protein